MSFRLTKGMISSFISNKSGAMFKTYPTNHRGLTTIEFGYDHGDRHGMRGTTTHNRRDLWHISVSCLASNPVIEAGEANTSSQYDLSVPPVPDNVAASPIDPKRFASALDYVLRFLGEGDSWRARIIDRGEVIDRNEDRELRVVKGWMIVGGNSATQAARVPGLFDTDGALVPIDCWSDIDPGDGRTAGMAFTMHGARILRAALEGASRAYCQQYVVKDNGWSSEIFHTHTETLARIVVEHADGARCIVTSPIAPRQTIQFLRAGEAIRSVHGPAGAHLFCGPPIPDAAMAGPCEVSHRRVVFALRAGQPLLVGKSTILDKDFRVTVPGSVIGGLSEVETAWGRTRGPRPCTAYLDGPRYAVRDAVSGVHGAQILFFHSRLGSNNRRMFVVSSERFAMVELQRRYHTGVEGKPYEDGE